jgi:uncharacterized protein
MIIFNPFPVSSYQGPDYFCNRQAEIKKLTAHALNGMHTTLLSIRRMGKTGLVQHLFRSLEKRKTVCCLYTDIYATQSQKEFINQLSTAALRAFPAKKKFGKKIWDFITGLRPVISYDNLTGQPEVSLQFSHARQLEQSLESLLQYIDKSGKLTIIAIDEFQQISNYPEKNTEALLRTLIQPLKNIRFIFSGSSRHILTEMFADNKRPFFGSAQMLELKSIPRHEYEAFIRQHFTARRRKIDEASLSFISEWTKLHTYFTQVVCNRIFAEGHTAISLPDVQRLCNELLTEQEAVFFQYRNLLTASQWQLLMAIAKEDKLYQPNSKNFISRYKLGTPSNVKRSLDALMTKEMIYQEQDEKGFYYRGYDCFLARWLERL